MTGGWLGVNSAQAPPAIPVHRVQGLPVSGTALAHALRNDLVGEWGSPRGRSLLSTPLLRHSLM